MKDLILDENYNKEVNLVHASKGKRFANFFLDRIFSSVLSFCFFYVLFFIKDSIYLQDYAYTEPFSAMWFIETMLELLFISFYYILLESYLKGKTLAKYFTKTKVLNLDGSKPSFETIVKRSFIRLVPFEAFSFLGDEPDGWHDRWSNTIVIDEELSNY